VARKHQTIRYDGGRHMYDSSPSYLRYISCILAAALIFLISWHLYLICLFLSLATYLSRFCWTLKVCTVHTHTSISIHVRSRLTCQQPSVTTRAQRRFICTPSLATWPACNSDLVPLFVSSVLLFYPIEYYSLRRYTIIYLFI
jgi:hypothetical protein